MIDTPEALRHVPAGEGETLQVMLDQSTLKVRRREPGSAFALSEVATPPQGGPPGLHRHPDQETFYVLEGRYRFDTLHDGQPRSLEAGPGDVVHIPSLVWHNYKNIGATPGKQIVILQPGDLIDFFLELGVPVSDKANPPRPSGPPDMARIAAIMRKHHVEMMDRAGAS